MRHVQHLSLESLVKMDHFQKELPLNLKGPLGHKGGLKGPVPKGQIGNPAQTECPLWVISGHVQCKRRCPLSANSGHCLYSITSSARPMSVFGMLMPSALAVLRLMVSSTLVTCWTGKLAGFSPLRIRST